MALPNKYVDDYLDYQMVFSGKGWGTDTITGTPTVVSDMPGLTISRISTDGASTVKWWLAGGTPGLTANITVEVATSGGRTFEGKTQVFIAP